MPLIFYDVVSTAQILGWAVEESIVNETALRDALSLAKVWFTPFVRAPGVDPPVPSRGRNEGSRCPTYGRPTQFWPDADEALPTDGPDFIPNEPDLDVTIMMSNLNLDDSVDLMDMKGYVMDAAPLLEEDIDLMDVSEDYIMEDAPPLKDDIDWTNIDRMNIDWINIDRMNIDSDFIVEDARRSKCFPIMDHSLPLPPKKQSSNARHHQGKKCHRTRISNKDNGHRDLKS